MSMQGNDDAEDQQPTQSDQERMQTLARDKSLSREAANWRTKFRGAESEIQNLRSRISELEGSSHAPQAEPAEAITSVASSSLTQSPATVDAAGDTSDDELADTIALRDELRAALLHQDFAGAGALYPSESVALLSARGQLIIADDGTPALVIDGKSQPISRDGLETLLRPEFIRAAGTSGTGSRGGKGAVPPGLDVERAKRDLKYYNANKQQVIAYLKGRQ